MRVVFSPSAEKSLTKIPTTEGLKITKKLRVLETNPYVGKKLSGDFKKLYSLKAWPYRIIYVIFPADKTILIVNIEHRQGVYK